MLGDFRGLVNRSGWPSMTHPMTAAVPPVRSKPTSRMVTVQSCGESVIASAARQSRWLRGVLWGRRCGYGVEIATAQAPRNDNLLKSEQLPWMSVKGGLLASATKVSISPHAVGGSDQHDGPSVLPLPVARSAWSRAALRHWWPSADVQRSGRPGGSIFRVLPVWDCMGQIPSSLTLRTPTYYSIALVRSHCRWTGA